jgi:hypothetical protein
MTTRRGCAVLAAVLWGAAPATGEMSGGPEILTPVQQPATTRPTSPSRAPGQTPRPAASAPQGFSVVLVLGDLQGASTADDVPLAARKALADMRDFLPFKSYRLLDAAWLLCCGYESRRGPVDERRPAQSAMDHISQILRGPEDNEYELMLGTSRAENAQVFVQFRLLARGEPDTTAAAVADTQFARQLADYQDKKAFLETQLKELRQKVEVGIAPGAEVSKLELELRSVQRRIEELNSRLAKGSARTTRSASSGTRQMVIDTSFTMDVGETVVVGTSRLKGGTRALIALLTAVPPRAGQKE